MLHSLLLDLRGRQTRTPRALRNCLLVALTLAVHAGWAQVNMTTTGSYSQDFNTLSSSNGTTPAWADNSTLANWYWQMSGTNPGTYRVDNGNSTTGSRMDYGTIASSDRAMGSLGSGTPANLAWGVQLRNTSATTITDLKVSFTGEQWRAANTTAHTATFYYKISSSAITALNPNVNATWVAVTALNFSSPTNTTVGAIDGNAAANRTTFTNISIPSLSLAANEYIVLKWDDIDNTGADHGLSIDDVTISWTVTGATPTVGFSTTTSNTSEGLIASVAVSMNIAPAADVTVTISDLGTGSATSGSDYTALSPAPTLTFLTSDTYPKVLNVSIPILDELAPENAETIDLGLAVTTGTATLGTAAHTVTIAASDLPTVGFATTTSGVTEGATATVDVSMNTAPATDLTVQVTRTGGTATSGTDFTTFPATNLTFLAAGSYPQTQSVSVITTDDGDFESAETVILGVAITVGSATLGTSSHTLTINDNELATLVINEVDYDNVGTDNAEWIELYNYGASAVNLNGFKLEFGNGAAGALYQTINLTSGSVAAGGYYVIGNSAGIPNINLVVTPPADLIQNGGQDGISLKSPSNTMVDAISYEGNCAGYTEGTGFTGADDNSTADKVIARVPNGTDSNNNNVDWLVWCATPGALNNPDSDGDGTADCTDGCPNDPNKIAPGICGCGVPNTDSDADGIADCIDACPFSVNTTPNLNLTSCNCELGYYAGYTTMGANQVLTSCTLCPPGSYCPDGISSSLCGAGYFSSSFGQISCDACSAGKFSDLPGATSCQDCPAGSFSDVLASTSCQSCPAGSFSDVTGSTVCQGCPAGSFSDVTGSTVCQSCPAGYFSDVIGSTVCQGCPAGSFSGVTGSTVCQSCPSGTYNPAIAAVICSSCPNGENSAPGATTCFPDADADVVDDNIDNCLGTANTDQSDADADGVGDACDGCPNDPLKTAPGNCGCGLVETGDTDEDGVFDCLDGCPFDDTKTSPGNCGCGNPEPGAACDDGDNTTGDDTVQPNCTCLGVPVDCNYVPAGPDLPGTPCDDGNINTQNDTWSVDCLCEGQFMDCLGVPGGSALPGTSCDDGMTSTGADIYDADCVCAGEFIDCLGVPGGSALVGTPCDDANSNTANDQYQANCACAGTVICPDNITIMELNTDGNGDQTSWEIVPGAGGAAVCSGSTYANNTTIIANCCLPNGCYRLVVYDSFGDGMSTGGYRLKDVNGKRIIDNWGDGVFGGTSAIANNGTFCVPVGADAMQAGSCDQLNLLPTSVVAAVPNAGVSAQWGVGSNTDDGYQFWIYDPDGSYSRTIFKSLSNPGSPGTPPGATAPAYLKLSSLSTMPVPPNVKLNIKVRSRVNGVYAEFGPACTLRINISINCVTQLLDSPLDPKHSCGVTGKVVGAAGNTGKLYCLPVPGANKYQWRFDAPGYARVIATTSTTLALNPWVTSPLLCGTNSYDVTVRSSFDNGANYCSYGPVCSVGITNSAPNPCTAAFQGGSQHSVQVEENGLRLWPNPARDGNVTLELNGLDPSAQTLSIDMFDVFGKQVLAESLATDGAEQVTTVIHLTDLATGLYTVHVRSGESTFVQRLVIE